MVNTRDTAIAVASVEGALTWTWELKIDGSGVYRWYLNGDEPTNLGGATQLQAESALRSFVEHSLRDELRITELSPRINPDSEEKQARWKSASGA